MILIINGGSSSIKFALYKQGNLSAKIFYGQLSRVGLPHSEFTFHHLNTGEKQTIPFNGQDFTSAIAWLMDWLEKRVDMTRVIAIGHRVVHGMQHREPSLITAELLLALKQCIPYDPDHLPNEIKLVEAFRQQHPQIDQFACFDTAFHQTMPRVARLLAVPRRFDALGIQRYGFHGLSYNYLVQELEKQDGKGMINQRIVLAHLGNGASLAAVHEGKSIDSSMGFTPASGLPMSTRSGDLDPGVAWFMMKTDKLSPTQFNHLVNHESGLLGISETSADMTDLLRQEATDIRSAEAVNLFCYQVKKWIGAFAAAMGGIDGLVFAGGIGEHAPIVRARICRGLEFLGIELDEKRNAGNDALISADTGKVAVRVMHTDEEWMVAKIVSGMIVDKGIK